MLCTYLIKVSFFSIKLSLTSGGGGGDKLIEFLWPCICLGKLT